jgi:hypothetical protein
MLITEIRLGEKLFVSAINPPISAYQITAETGRAAFKVDRSAV